MGITRFAPSPTGYLHEGHLLSALYVWAAAEIWDLKILLRIEDHDKSRARASYIQAIKEDLEWLGFRYDFFALQSNRAERFENALKKLKEENLIYPCFCSRKILEKENPKSKTGEIIYQGNCRHLAQNDNAVNLPYAIRFKVPVELVEWNDFFCGTFKEAPFEQCGDFSIRDREGQWTYQFAVSVDDIEDKITHIIRGEDICSSTARQILLKKTLDKSHAPLYFHHPLIFDNAGKKLSKRKLAHSIRQDKEAGKSPEDIFGKLLFRKNLIPQNKRTTLAEAIACIKKQFEKI